MLPRVIFLHGMKSGGTSLRYMLLDEFGYDAIAPVPMGASQTEVDYPTLRGVDPLQYQMQMREQDVSCYRVVMSHYDWRIVNRLPGWGVITLLRHPVEQIVSLYQFMLSARDFEAFRFTAPPFLEWVQGEGKVFLNGQTRLLSGHGRESVHVAMTNLTNPRLSFGLLEHFEESVARWNERFGWSLVVEHRNKSEKIALSDEAIKLVEWLQSDDMKLYDVACEIFGA
jgi:hypothetical protein